MEAAASSPAWTPTSLNAPSLALVQIEQVADAGDVRREAGERVRDRFVQIGVAGDEESGRPSPFTSATAAPVYQPSPRPQLRVGERPVARVPEHVDAARRRHDEVGVTVAVQIRGDTAVALDRQIGMRSALTSLNVPSTFSNNAVRGSPPCASQCGASALA